MLASRGRRTEGLGRNGVVGSDLLVVDCLFYILFILLFVLSNLPDSLIDLHSNTNDD
jgi:hypothetical protein